MLYPSHLGRRSKLLYILADTGCLRHRFLQNLVYYSRAIPQLLLPAMGTLYFALASIWRLPYGEQVVGTITAVDAFLGVILGITTAQYKQKQKTDAA